MERALVVVTLIFAVATVAPPARAKAPPKARPAAKAPAKKRPPSPKAPPAAEEPAPEPAAPATPTAPAAAPAPGAAPGTTPATPPTTAASPASAAAPATGAPAASAPAPAAATPAPEPVPATQEKKTPPPQAATERAPATDIAKLRAEYQDLKEALFRSRARRETLEKALLNTQILPTIEWVGSRRFVVKSAELRLDGVRVWEAGEGQVADKPIAIAPRSLAPGAHVLGVRVEIRPRDNAKLGYVSEQSFALDIPEGKKTTIEITVDEDGDPPSYNPEIDIEVDN